MDGPTRRDGIQRAVGAWWIVYLAAEDGGTRVRLAHLGFGEGEGWDGTRDFLERGDAFTLDRLRQRFARRAQASGSRRPNARQASGTTSTIAKARGTAQDPSPARVAAPRRSAPPGRSRDEAPAPCIEAGPATR